MHNLKGSTKRFLFFVSILRKILPVKNPKAPVESRLLEISLFTTVLIFYFWSILGVYFGYEWPVLTVYLVGSVVYSVLYAFYKRGGSHRKISLLYYFLVFIMLGVAWLPSGGLVGAITYFVVLVFLSGLLVLDPRDFRLFVLVSIGLVLVFTLYEFYVPDAAALYTDKMGLIRDLAIANVTMLGVLAITMYIFKRAYAYDRVRLKRANYSLELEKLNVEKANKAKTTFLANVSHEMRTPLNGIVGTAELLKQTDLTEEQSEMINDMVYSSDILRGLISNVLDITMIEEGKMVLLNNQFDYHKVVSEVKNFFSPLLREQNELQLIIETDYSIPVRLLGDPSRLSQILINLVNNAIKFTDSGYVKVATKLISKDPGGVIIKTLIEDSGRGISPEHQEHIFDEFHRDEKVAGIEGTGLGLSICKKIISAMGGNLRLERSTSEGTVFSFTIPLSIPKHGSAEDSNQPKLSYDIDLSQLRILIAEDQPINQMVLTKMLKNIGINSIELAEDGQKAIDLSMEKTFDFILMDIRMPVKDGIQASKEILSHTDGQKAPVIISITANALKVDQEACYEVGIKDFISKPFNMEVLRTTLEKYVDTKL